MNRRDLDHHEGERLQAKTPRSLAIWPILVGWLLVIGWLVSPLASGVGGRWQYVVWIPDWVWLVLIGFCAGLAGFILAMGRRPRSLRLLAAAGLMVLGPLWGTLHRDVGLRGGQAAEDPIVVFLNAQDPGSRVVDDVVEKLIAMDAAVVVIVNPGWIPITWRAIESKASTGRFLQRSGHFFVASRAAIASMRRIVTNGEIRAVEVTFELEDGSPLPRRILVADLPSDLAVNRAESLRTLAAGIAADVEGGPQADSRFDLLVGDLNTTPRTPELNLVVPGFQDAFTMVGRGWGGTWPRDRGWLRIDFALVPPDRMPTSVKTFDPGSGGHRGLVIGYRRP